MPTGISKTLDLRSEEDTLRFAQALARTLRPGDTILLEGQLGSGKTFLARHIIQTRLAFSGRQEDVPSPSFTLVQTYDDGESEIVHADLYRLNGIGDCIELGLEDAFGTAICLIEWPDRLGAFAPVGSLVLRLAQGPGSNQRILTIECATDAWNDRLALLAFPPETSVDQFLDAGDWAGTSRISLAGDASNRRYERLVRASGETAVLMIAPPTSGEDVRPFLQIGGHLEQLGLSAPRVLQADVGAGYLLLEDLGDQLYARYAAKHPDEERRIYEAAVDALVFLHRHEPPENVGDYDIPLLVERAALSVEWYGKNGAGCHFSEELEERFSAQSDRTAVLALRDFHAENLIWLPDRSGVRRVGLLDFQDALACHPAYDLVSLTKDARRDLGDGLEDVLIRRYLESTGRDHGAFLSSCSLYGAQRNLRILGVFARLAKRDGKSGYLKLVPRVWRHLLTSLADPKLEALRALVLKALPEPTEAYLAHLERSCHPNP